ncbi:hypothetical protein AB6883_12875 [Carnobacterium maltaromaticum]|uniref:hypothetical protein n=1 Tax=Carnobacterium maltaromaticum TaxID=2751 RepID=UPI0028926917|nr:hypothetical protein [Carnobacterium maltaromaticum]MDT1943348.1 hypothetical protein [Carnobacterium maltaromaticum]MDT1998728.1 hypothetical protein [Carnobacterium maltaromaticum]
MNVTPKEFALSVVSSSKSDLSVQEKYELFEEAYDYIKMKNEELNSKKPKQDVKKTIEQFKKLGL